MKKNNVSRIWEELSQDNTPGMTRRLYDSGAKYKIYCTFTQREHLYGIAMSYSRNIALDLNHFKSLKHITISKLRDPSFPNNELLIFYFSRSLDSSLLGVFAELCENIVLYVCNQQTEERAVKEFVNQLVRWEKLFEKITRNGLSRQQQIGLYGELYFLAKMIHKFPDQKDGFVNAWVGPMAEIQDFQSGNWAIEVKTSTGTNPQSVTINNEKQLDDDLRDNLFLYHLSVSVGQGDIGETLPGIVDRIRRELQDSQLSLITFDIRLNQAEYFDSDEELYSEQHYVVRKENIFQVKGDFPRIKEADLRNGVGDVEYLISIPACDQYLITENELFQKIAQ